MDLDFIKNLAYRKTQEKASDAELFVWKEICESLTTDKELDDNLIPILARELYDIGVDRVKLRKLFEILSFYAESKEDVLTKKNIIFIFNVLSQEFSLDTCVINVGGAFVNQITQTINLLENNELENWEETFVIDQIYNPYELAFIYKEILKYYERQMKTIVDLIMGEDIAFSIETMDEMEEDFRKIYLKYKYILNKFNLLDFSQNLEQEEFLEEDKQRKLYYSTNSKEDASKCYFIRDLKSIREDELDTIYELLENFKNGYNNDIKALKNFNSERNFIELKYDQIRIVLTRIEKNSYSVMGVFIKKADNEFKIYKSLMERPVADIDDSYSEAVDTYYKEYIFEHSREGGR